MSVVDVESRERVLIVTLNRPAKRNALTPEADALLREAFEHFTACGRLW